ncbi:MAG: hypothetical protein JEY96_18345 [Bacteroidales bacterium]|nr:hypothetical protein [Bacteroidales bacterium]
MLKLKNIFIFIFFIFTICHSYAQQNPFFTSQVTKDSTQNIEQQSSQIKKKDKKIQFSIFNKFIKQNARLQKRIKDKFSNLAKSYNKSGSVKAFILVFLLSFLYGIFHSLGPGHGKVFIFSYILTENPKVLKAIYISYLIAAVHAISGMIVSLIIIFSLKTFATASASISNTSDFISQLSFAFIVIIGISLLIKTIRSKGHHSHSHHHVHDANKISKLPIIPFILSLGIVPCPGTIIMVTFLSSIGLLSIGLFSVFFIILGMGITISVIGLISLFSKKFIQRIASSKFKNYEAIYQGVSLFGASLLIFFGILFFIGSFN